MHRKLEARGIAEPHLNNTSTDPYLGNPLLYPPSPAHRGNQEPDLSPLTNVEFTPFALDFDISALNQFLTSGDLNTFVNHHSETPQSDVFVPQMQRPYPKASDAIKPAWFTNMEERDLENEAAMLRSVTYSNGDDAMNSGQSGQSDHEIELDEAWRHNLNVNLVPQVFNIIGPLPSIEFLV